MRLIAGLLAVLGAGLICFGHPQGGMAQVGVGGQAERLDIPGLQGEVRLARDKDGVVHIFAATERDLFLAQGFAHARDRLFQMDVFRRQAGGTLAELLGETALAADVELRVLGLRRAAERSIKVLEPATLAALEAYAAGVNTHLARHPLPPEYAALELTSVPPWTALDSVAVAKLIASNFSFDLDDIQRTETLLAYRAAGQEKGFDGDALFFQDLNRIAPFAPAATVPDANGGASPAAHLPTGSAHTARTAPANPDSGVADLAEDFSKRMQRLRASGTAKALSWMSGQSNGWAVGPRRACGQRPILANDVHLDLTTPPFFHPVHLAAPAAGFDVVGGSIAGTPFAVLGHNARISWGVTTNQFDFTDVYQEQLASGSGGALGTTYQGQQEPVLALPQTFRANRVGNGAADDLATVPPGSAGVPAAVLVVPRRNNGPIVSPPNPGPGPALSVQWAGLGATRELDGFRRLNRAGKLAEFKAALQFIDAAGQNFVYADVEGNIAYFASGRVPLREDLQAGTVAGAGPLLIRNGTGGNEWVKPGENAPAVERAIGYVGLPFQQLPQVVNPSAGFVVTANNDPLGITLDNDPLNQRRKGGGIYYLSPIFNFGIHAQRITNVLRQHAAEGCIGIDDTKALQADTVMLDAQVFAPRIFEAFENAGTGSAPPALAGCGAGTSPLRPASRKASMRATTRGGFWPRASARSRPASPPPSIRSGVGRCCATRSTGQSRRWRCRDP